MIYQSKKQPKKAALISVILYALAAVLFILSNFITPTMPYQLIALVLVSIGVFLTSRYILTDYKYVIKDAEYQGDKIKFLIVKINGKRESVMADFELSSAYALEKCKKISEFEKKHGKVNKYYGYTSNILSPDKYMLAIEFNNMKVLFGIEINERFAAELSARIKPDSSDDAQNEKE